LELIDRLYNKGSNSVQISDFLNENQIRSPSGLKYNPTLVWVTNNKFQKRKKRIADTKVSVDQDFFFTKEGVNIWTV